MTYRLTSCVNPSTNCSRGVVDPAEDADEGHNTIAAAQRIASSGLDSRTFFCNADFSCDGESVWRPALAIALANAMTKFSPSSEESVNALSRIVSSRPMPPAPLRGLLVNFPSHLG